MKITQFTDVPCRTGACAAIRGNSGHEFVVFAPTREALMDVLLVDVGMNTSDVYPARFADAILITPKQEN